MRVKEVDPVIAEVREARHRISARFGHDARRLVDHYLQKQEQHRDRPPGVGIAEPEAVAQAHGCGGPATRAAELGREAEARSPVVGG